MLLYAGGTLNGMAMVLLQELEVEVAHACSPYLEGKNLDRYPNVTSHFSIVCGQHKHYQKIVSSSNEWTNEA